jgi:hypothetical protein
MSIAVFMLISNFMLLLNFNAENYNYINSNSKSKEIINHIEDLDLKVSASSLTEYSSTGGAKNVTEYGIGNFANNGLNITNNENASIIVPNYWNVNEITCNISDIFDYNSMYVNETFDSGIDSNLWTNYTDRPQNVTFGWYNTPSDNNDSIYIRFEYAGSVWNGIDSYVNLTFDVPRTNIPFSDVDLNYNYWVRHNNSLWLPGPGGAKHYAELQVNGVSAAFSGKLDTLDNNTIYQDNIPLFSFDQYGMTLPGTVSLLFGVNFGNSGIDPTGYLEFLFDNISLTFSTIPKPSHINLTMIDYTNNSWKTSISDIGLGEGTVNLQDIWDGGIGGKSHFFGFESNSSGDLIINSNFEAKATSAIRTRTLLGANGSEFAVENNTVTTWTMYFPVTIPGSYDTDYYVNVSKPINWNVTQLINPYLNNKIGDVTATAGIGNSTLTIPNNILTNGIWKIVAEAPNYVTEAKLYQNVSSVWIENNTFQVPETIKINASIDTQIIPNIDETNATLIIYYPNGTMWYQENATVDSSGNVEFSVINLDGTNTTIGQYTIHVRWNSDDLFMSQVGLKILNFEITKDSLLERSNFHASKNIPSFSGDNILLKANFTDYYTGEGLADAIVNYTIDNTTAITGTMAYQGGGIYIADIDTTGLLIGVYNVTVSANKSFYQVQSNLELFEIEIQLYTSLNRLEFPTTVQMNDNATVKFWYEDSYTSGIIGATVELDINLIYVKDINDEGNGNYTIIFNAAGFSGLGAQQLTFNFSATGYETQINILQFEIVEQDVNLTVAIDSVNITENTLINKYFTENITVSARAFGLVDNQNLEGGVITWISDNYVKNLTEFSGLFNTTVIMDGANFSAGINYIYIQFQQTNYSIKTFSFILFLRAQTVNITLEIDGQPIIENALVEKSFNQVFNISCKAYANAEKIFLTGGNFTFVNDEDESSINEYGNFWFNRTVTITTSDFDLGINYVYVKFEQNNYTTTTFSFQLQVQQIGIDPQPQNFQGILAAYVGEAVKIEIKLLEEGSPTVINGAIVKYSWDYGVGDFIEKGNGVYEVSFELPPSLIGTFEINLIISKSGGVFQVLEYPINIHISEREAPPYFAIIIVIALVGIVGVLGLMSLRSYVILPKKRKKEAELLAKTQRFKDVRNIQALLLIHRDMSTPLYSASYTFLQGTDPQLFSGIIQALLMSGRQIAASESDEIMEKVKDVRSKDLMEFDFKFFHLLIYDYKASRISLVLKESSSDRLKELIKTLAKAIYDKFGDRLDKFDGDLIPFREGVPPIVMELMDLPYKEPFKFTSDKKYLNTLVTSKEITKMERRIINVLISHFKRQEFIYLEEILKIVTEKNEDFLIEGIEALLKKKVLVLKT